MSTPLIRTFGSTVLLALSLTFAGCQGYGPGPTAQPMAPLFGPSGSAPHQAPPPTYAATPRPVAQPAPRPAPTPAPAPKPAPPPPRPTAPAAPSYPRSGWMLARQPTGVPLMGGATLWEVRATHAGKTVDCTAVVFDSRRFELRVIDQPNPNAGGRVIADAMRAHRASAGINGGFFTPTFDPLGLMIASGRTTGIFKTSGILSGAVMQFSSEPYILWNNEYQGSSGVTNLVQGGPRLVNSASPVGGLDHSKSSTRSFVASDGRHNWIIGTTGSTDLASLAEMLATPGIIPGVNVMRALNLDGGRSSAIWAAPANGREISRPGWSTVRNYLAIVPR